MVKAAPAGRGYLAQAIFIALNKPINKQTTVWFLSVKIHDELNAGKNIFRCAFDLLNTNKQTGVRQGGCNNLRKSNSLLLQ